MSLHAQTFAGVADEIRAHVATWAAGHGRTLYDQPGEVLPRAVTSPRADGYAVVVGAPQPSTMWRGAYSIDVAVTFSQAPSGAGDHAQVTASAEQLLDALRSHLLTFRSRIDMAHLGDNIRVNQGYRWVTSNVRIFFTLSR